MWLAWLFGKPVIGWLHNDPAMMKGWGGWKQKFGAWTLRKLDRLVIIAEKLRSRSPEWWDQSKVQVLNNGVQLPESLSVADPQPQGPWNDECSLTYLSSMDDAKGWRVLLEAAGLLAQKGLHPKINFYGPASVDPSSKVISTADEIKRTLDAANAAGIRAAWHGPVTGDAKWSALRAGQIFVFPSYSEREAFPLAVLEAMGAGLPIVATDVGGVSDALVDEQSNFVVPPQSAQALADAVAAMMADPTLRERLSQHNRARYESHFTVSQFMARWGELLNERLNH